MKPNNKGFTLIELLAVIVILAVIALIATPIIMGVIEDAKKQAERDSAYGFVKAVEQTIAVNLTKTPDATIGAITTTKVGEWDITYKGTKPDSVSLEYDSPTGKIEGTITYGTRSWTVNADGTISEPNTGNNNNG